MCVVIVTSCTSYRNHTPIHIKHNVHWLLVLTVTEAGLTRKQLQTKADRIRQESRASASTRSKNKRRLVNSTVSNVVQVTISGEDVPDNFLIFGTQHVERAFLIKLLLTHFFKSLNRFT